MFSIRHVKGMAFHRRESSYTGTSFHSVEANKIQACMETAVENVVHTLYIQQWIEHNKVALERSMPVDPEDALNAGVDHFVQLVLLFQPRSRLVLLLQPCTRWVVR